MTDERLIHIGGPHACERRDSGADAIEYRRADGSIYATQTGTATYRGNATCRTCIEATREERPWERTDGGDPDDPEAIWEMATADGWDAWAQRGPDGDWQWGTTRDEDPNTEQGAEGCPTREDAMESAEQDIASRRQGE